MSNHRLSSFPTRRSSRGGFTLIELLVVIAIIGVLASVTVPAVMSGLTTAKENVAMQNARSIGMLMFQYSIDNNNLYPPDNSQGAAFPITSSGAFEQVVTNKYTTSDDIFWLSGGATTGKYSGSAPGATGALGPQNNSWDISGMAGTPASSGINSNAPDQLPLVFTTGNTFAYPASVGVGANANTLSATNPFSKMGIAVCYKGNNAQFKKVNDSDGSSVDSFISTSFDAGGVVFTQLKP